MKIKELELNEITSVSGGVGALEYATAFVVQGVALFAAGVIATNVFTRPTTGLGAKQFVRSLFANGKLKHAAFLGFVNYAFPFIGAFGFGFIGMGLDALFNRGEAVEKQD